MLAARAGARLCAWGIANPCNSWAAGFEATAQLARVLGATVGWGPGPLAPTAAQGALATAHTSAAVPWVPSSQQQRGYAAQSSGSAAQGPADLREHPHHSYADTHRPHVEYIYRRATAVSQEASPRPLMLTRHTDPPPPADVLAALAEQHCVADVAVFTQSVLKLPVARQHALLQHASAVSVHLQGLGVGTELVGRTLQHCPALFSFPTGERVEVLMRELMEAIGCSPSQAAALFVRCPALANTRHVMPSIVRLVWEHHDQPEGQEAGQVVDSK